MYRNKTELRIAGVIGDPINHTRSPLIHQYWINKNQINCFYIPIRIKNYELEIRIQDLEEKFSKDLSEDTFNQLKELKKLQNLN